MTGIIYEANVVWEHKAGTDRRLAGAAGTQDWQIEGLNPVDEAKWREHRETADLIEQQYQLDGDRAKRDQALVGVYRSGYADALVAHNRNFLFECDDMPLQDQHNLALDLAAKGIVNRAVYSGGKSIHMRISISDDLRDESGKLSKELYGAVWQMLNDRYFRGKALADVACKNPSRGTRRPGVARYDIVKAMDGAETISVRQYAHDVQGHPVFQDLVVSNSNVVDITGELALLQARMHARSRYLATRQANISARMATRAAQGRGPRTGDGSRRNSPAVQDFLCSPFKSQGGNGGEAHRGIFRAIIACIGGEDRSTLADVLAKARAESWTEQELQAEVRSAERYLAKSA